MGEPKKYRLPQELPKHGGRLSSGSQLHRTMACPLSELLPHTADVPPWIKKAASRGTALHKALEHMGSLKAYQEIHEQYHEEIKSIDYAKAVGRFTEAQCREIKFSYDLRTGQVNHLLKAEGEKERDYGQVEPYQVTCTIDVLIVGASHFEVWDYKTPKDKRYLDKYLPPEKNIQLLFGALCAKILVCPMAETCTLGIQHIPSMECWKETIPVTQLAVFESQLKQAYQRAEEDAFDFELGTVRPNPGSYCDLCPGRYECPKDEGAQNEND